MTLGSHSLNQEQLRNLASGGGGQAVMQELIAAQYSKHLILLRGVVEAVSADSKEIGRQVRQAVDLLSAAHRRDPESTAARIRHPGSGAWATRTVLAARAGRAMPGAEPSRLSGLAAAAAVSAGLCAEIAVPVMADTVVLPSLGSAVVTGGEAVVRSGPDRNEIVSSAGTVQVPSDPYQDAPSWRGMRRLGTGDFDVLLDDIDPFRLPASANVAPRLTDADVADWQAIVSEAWQLLKADHRADADEAAAVVTVVVPLVAPEEGISSSSSAEAFGAIAMSKPPSPQSCAATIVHELQHLKLSAVIDIVPLTDKDRGDRFYVGWRDDPRPASGLLQGAYAHLGLLRFWRQELRSRRGDAQLTAQREFARWLPATVQAVATLEASQCLTPEGRNFTAGMRDVLSDMVSESVPIAATTLAEAAAVRISNSGN